MPFLVGGNPSKIIGNKTTPHSTFDLSTLGISTLDIMVKLPYELAKQVCQAGGWTLANRSEISSALK